MNRKSEVSLFVMMVIISVVGMAVNVLCITKINYLNGGVKTYSIEISNLNSAINLTLVVLVVCFMTALIIVVAELARRKRLAE